MDTSQICEVKDILELTETKQYIAIPKVIHDALETAVRHKTISDGAMNLWLKLYVMVRSREVVAPDWSLRQSMKKLAEEKGCAVGSIKTYLKQLEQGRFIITIRERNRLLHESFKILVRFPKSGIEVAKQLPDRRRSCSTRNIESLRTNKDDLFTEKKSFLSARSNKICTSNINNKETNNKNNNTDSDTGLSTIDEVPLDEITNDFVDCCKASPKSSFSPQHTEVIGDDDRLRELELLEKELGSRYESSKKLDDYTKLTSCREAIKRIAKKAAAKAKNPLTQAEVPSTSKALQFMRRESRVEVSGAIEVFIETRLRSLKAEFGFSFELSEQVKIIIEQISDYTYVNEVGAPVTMRHHANILISTIKNKKKLLTPTKSESSKKSIRDREKRAGLAKRNEIESAQKIRMDLNFAA